MAKSLKLPTAWNSQSLLVQIPKNSELSREVLDPSWSPATSYLGSFWFSSLGSIIPASHSHSVCDPFPLLSERQPLHLSPSWLIIHLPPLWGRKPHILWHFPDHALQWLRFLLLRSWLCKHHPWFFSAPLPCNSVPWVPPSRGSCCLSNPWGWRGRKGCANNTFFLSPAVPGHRTRCRGPHYWLLLILPGGQKLQDHGIF